MKLSLSKKVMYIKSSIILAIYIYLSLGIITSRNGGTTFPTSKKQREEINTKLIQLLLIIDVHTHNIRGNTKAPCKLFGQINKERCRQYCAKQMYRLLHKKSYWHWKNFLACDLWFYLPRRQLSSLFWLNKRQWYLSNHQITTERALACYSII